MNFPSVGDFEMDFVGAAMITLLWTETNPDHGAGDHPLLDMYDTEDISEPSKKAFDAECRAFLDLVAEEMGDDVWEGLNPDDMGHLFVLSKNGHGTGFWDCGLGDKGDELHKWAKTFGESMAYVGNDGKVWIA